MKLLSKQHRWDLDMRYTTDKLIFKNHASSSLELLIAHILVCSLEVIYKITLWFKIPQAEREGRHT